MTTTQQSDLTALVLESIEQHGSQARAAVALGVNAAYLTHIIQGKLEKVSEAQWNKIALSLNYSAQGWVMVPCVNTKQMDMYLSDAKSQSMMLAVSSPAGSGKTSYARHFARQHRAGNVYMLECGVWRAKTFLRALCSALGIYTDNINNRTADFYMEKAVEFLNAVGGRQPLVILDEFADLKPCAFASMKTLYNRLEDNVGIVMMATEHLEQVIDRGVSLKRKGYDEVSSRLGRKFLKLRGMTEKEVAAVAVANGVENKHAHRRIWSGSMPRKIEWDGGILEVVPDLRRMKRMIKQERLMLAN